MCKQFVLLLRKKKKKRIYIQGITVLNALIMEYRYYFRHHRNDSSHQGSKQSETEATLSPPKQDIDAKDSQISYLNTARTTTTHPSESLVTVSARTVRSQQQAVAGSDYLNVAIASQRLGRARQHPHQS